MGGVLDETLMLDLKPHVGRFDHLRCGWTKLMNMAPSSADGGAIPARGAGSLPRGRAESKKR
jgi:hypothetical protein